MIHIVFYGMFIDYDLSGATGQPIEEGKTFTETQPHTKEDAVENEMVILPPLMEPENGKKEEGKATPAEEGKGDADEEREEASETGEMVENPFFNGLDEEGDNDSKMDGAVGESKGLIIKREAEDQEAKEEALRKAEAEEAALSNAKKGVEASLEEARIAWISGCLQMLSGKQSWEQDKGRETQKELTNTSIKQELTLDEE